MSISLRVSYLGDQ